MRLIHCLLILLSTFLSPNYTAEPAQIYPNKVVTQISVTTVHDGQTSVKNYTNSSELKAILTYLRMTQPTAAMEYEPDSFRSDSYTFTLCFSDGTQNIYRQIYHDYLQKNSGRWQRIDPKADLLFPSL